MGEHQARAGTAGMLTDFLLDADSEPCEGLPCDDLNERAMRMGSLALLRAVERAQGKWAAAPNPIPPLKPQTAELVGRRIVRMTAEAYGLTVSELIDRSRKRRAVCARMVAARLLRDQRRADGSHRFSLPQIAQMLGPREHTTIHYLLQMFGPYRRQYPEMKANYKLLRRRLRGG